MFGSEMNGGLSMFVGPVRLSLFASLMAFGAIGATLALIGTGVPLPVAAVVAAALAGLVQWMALRAQPPVEPPERAEAAGLRNRLEAYQRHTAALRHDLRGVLSPALMMSDRLINHADPTVQRAGTAVVRSINRATGLLTGSRELMALDAEMPVDAGARGGGRDGR